MMKVLISLFQVFVMVLVVLFSIGVLEVVSYRTVNEPLAKSIRQSWSYSRLMFKLFKWKQMHL